MCSPGSAARSNTSSGIRAITSSAIGKTATTGNYIGASHLVHEYLAGPSGPLLKLRINFLDPAEMLDAGRYRDAGVLAVCARIGDLDHPVNFGRF